MLRLVALKPRNYIAPARDAAIRRRGVSGAQAEQGLEGGHRVLAAIVPKDELIEVRLQLRAAHAMIGADQPLLEIPDSAVRQGHDRRRALAERLARRLGARDVRKARLGQAGEATQPVRVHRGARRDVLLHERRYRGRLEVAQDTHAHAARAITALPGALLDHDQHRHGVPPFQLAAPAEARLGTADPGIVRLDLPVQWFPARD